jgi:putative salt-induced outer membrane protein YdiY
MLILLAISTALAQDPTYDRTTAPAEAVQKPETDLSAELGFTQSAGNTFTFTVNAALKFAHRWGQNKFQASVGTYLNLGRLDENGNGTVADDEGKLQWTAQRAFGGMRYDRFVTTNNSLYLSFGGEHDKPAGLSWRFNEQIGYARQLVKNERTAASLEAGAAYAEENYYATTDADGNPIFTGELDAHYLATRLFFGVTHAFNDIVSIGETLEAIEPLIAYREGQTGMTNFQDFRFNNVFDVTAKVSDKFSLKVSDRLMFDNQPVTPEYSKVDNVAMVTLVATIL